MGQKSQVFLAAGFRVIAVEPNPNCFPAINYKFGRNSDFTLVSSALGAAPGRTTLNFVDDDSTASLRAD
ncbi:FkbM family methyltransferase [Sphingomonas jinjuensis]|uniref:FkbM family methyltransferase n=1 Tax=Sphingomonas jinjuensis TaxID=535907 RepID=A0A840FAA5_9SPHN|nr:FkbM family methyltransferase [Sphingomonas jinjuensis]